MAYRVCTWADWQRLQADQHEQVAEPSAEQQWLPALSGDGQFSVNRVGRLLFRTPDAREIIIGALPSTPQTPPSQPPRLYAIDRNCYHVGYPLDLGDIEELIVTSSSHHHHQHQKEKDQRVLCIRCPLHNRIFDTEDGSMVFMTYDTQHTPQASTAHSIRQGKYAGATVHRQPCMQRTHHVEIQVDGIICLTERYGGATAASDTYNGAGSATHLKP